MTEYTLPGWKINCIGALFIFPLLLLYGAPFVFIRYLWVDETAFSAFVVQNVLLISNVADRLWLPAAIVLTGMPLHELIHGMCMAIHASDGWKSVKFGFNTRALAPFTHCKEPLTPKAYRWCLVMPAAVQGCLPALVGWYTGNILWLLYGILFTWAAAGDLIILYLSRNIHSGMLQDHPGKAGFILTSVR
ncbi:MAG: DUF3267 domain-containing protein [Bacteroidales bacterium]|jgi:hypothetical protein|nr:DUF3267 domain-containing protein [Bacteroidales bacterium]